MANFNSYVSLPEGTSIIGWLILKFKIFIRVTILANGTTLPNKAHIAMIYIYMLMLFTAMVCNGNICLGKIH